MNKDSSTKQNSSNNDCGEEKEIETMKEDMNEEESVDDPLSIHQDNEDKEEDMYDYDRIDVEEFKIEADDNINNMKHDDDHDNEIKGEDMYDYEKIDIDEFKIEPIDNINM